jgi:hypothetical protein
MLLIQRVFGSSLVGYFPGSDGVHYDHREWLNERDVIQDESQHDASPGCFVTTLRRYSAPHNHDQDWSCDGGTRQRGEFFCRECVDHVD